MFRSLFLFSLCLLPGLVHGAENKTGVALAGGSYVDVVLGLVVVLALIYALAYVARRLNGATMAGNLPVKIVGGTSIGVREKIVLVEVGGKHILLGVAPGRVNTLHVFDEPIEMLREQRAEAAFAVRLKQILSQGEGK